MKIGHCQLQCTPGDIQANAEKVLAGLGDADREGLAIVSFPESFLTGYFIDPARARANSLSLEDARIEALLSHAAGFSPTWMVGFNERRGEELFNSVLVAQGGRVLGRYSKAFPCYDYFTPGREFPVFEREGVKFGIVICADGGYIEPTRILALKGAKIIFAPHYNFIGKEGLISHFMKVRADHTARAVENDVWFLRGNNVVEGDDPGLGIVGVGYGDSYLIDPGGEIVVRSRRHVENMIVADIDPDAVENPKRRTIASGRALGAQLIAALAEA